MNLTSATDKIKIQPIGSYFQVDDRGFLINPTGIQKIQTPYKPLIYDVVSAYKTIYTQNLKNVYIRGSVAKGEAIEGVSDLDSFAYVDLLNENAQTSKELQKIQKSIEERYTFISGVELHAKPISDALKDFVILNQAVCVYGEPLQAPKMKVGKDMAIHCPGFYKRVQWFEQRLKRNYSEQEVREDCVWLMKGIVRAGFELTMQKSKKYTRDLYPCYETFSHYYPQKQKEMRRVLELAINPTADKEAIKEIMDSFGGWLLEEIPKHFTIQS